MIIVWVGISSTNSIDVELPHANMTVDPRIITFFLRGCTFSFSVNGRTLTVTRTGADGGWDRGFFLRAYLPTEHIPDFTSTVYTYWGLDNERPPKDVTEAIIHPSVTTILVAAFDGCKSLLRVTIPDTVTRIEECAFHGCYSLRFIRLSRNLIYIGERAFGHCRLLQAVFLPPTVARIHGYAFTGCTSLRFLHMPDKIEYIGIDVVYGCGRLLTTVNYRFYDQYEEDDDDDEVHEWLMQRYANLHLHQACSSIYITPQDIVHGIERAMEIDEYQMTALHILCANPHVTRDAIRAYLHLAPGAANQEDSEGMNPFQYLLRNDIAFVEEDRSFSSLTAWWYHCMP